jgi:hypothetical protein
MDMESDYDLYVSRLYQIQNFIPQGISAMNEEESVGKNIQQPGFACCRPPYS